MKTVIILFAAIVGFISFTDNDKNIGGTWVLQGDDSSGSKAVIRIKMGEGMWKGKMDIPEQEVYDKELQSVKVNGDSIFITVFKNGSTINARMINDSTINGSMQLEGRQDAIKLKKI